MSFQVKFFVFSIVQQRGNFPFLRNAFWLFYFILFYLLFNFQWKGRNKQCLKRREKEAEFHSATYTVKKDAEIDTRSGEEKGGREVALCLFACLGRRSVDWATEKGRKRAYPENGEASCLSLSLSSSLCVADEVKRNFFLLPFFLFLW